MKIDKNKASRFVSFFFICLLAINVVYVLSGILNFPLRSMDAVGIWLLKAKAFYQENGFPWNFLHDSKYLYSHQQYPLLLSYFFFLIYKTAGLVKEVYALALYPLLYTLILYLAYKTFRLRAGRNLSLCFVYIYSMFSPLLAQSGRVQAGGADIFLCFAGWGLLFIIVSKRVEKYLVPVMLLTIIAAQIKIEGVFFSLIFLFLPIRAKTRILYFFLSIIPFLMWEIVVLFLKIPRDLYFSTDNLFLKTMNFFKDFFTEMMNIRNWYIFWPLFFGALFLKKSNDKKTKQEIVPFLGAVFVLFFLTNLFYSPGKEGGIAGLADRFLLQYSSFFFFIFFERTKSLFVNFDRLIYNKISKAPEVLSAPSLLKKPKGLGSRTRRVSP